MGEDYPANRSVNGWSRVFESIYAEQNRRRGPEQVWAGAVAHAGGVAKSIRLMSFQQALQEGAAVFAWLASLVSLMNYVPECDLLHLRNSLNDVLSFKYPDRCPHCLDVTSADDSCRCEPIRSDARTEKHVNYSQLGKCWESVRDRMRRWTIGTWEEMFWHLYGQNTYVLSVEALGFHFLEEVGEVSLSLRRLCELREVPEEVADADFRRSIADLGSLADTTTQYADGLTRNGSIPRASERPSDIRARIVSSKVGLVTEISDVFAWLCAISNKLERISKANQGLSLDTFERILKGVFWDESTGDRCPDCGTRPCSCRFFI